MTRAFFVVAGAFTVFAACGQEASVELAPPTVAQEALTAEEENLLRCDMNPILLTLDPAERAQFRRGCHLFFEETFEGNGRTCGSCHLQTLANGDASDNHFDFGPAHAQALFDADPTHPLFRAIDSDDGAGLDYSTLLDHGLVRIPFVLPPNVTVEEVDSPLVDVDPVTGRTTVHVLRSTPSVENMFFEDELMWDGRFGTDLEVQAVEAVLTHFESGRLPTDEETSDIAFFQEQQFTNARVRQWASGGPAPTLPEVPDRLEGDYWDSVRRGRNFFVDMPVSPDNPIRGGHCATCHSGPMLDSTNVFNPFLPPGLRITNNAVSETNMPGNPAFPPGHRVGLQLPELTYHIVLTHDVLVPPGAPVPLPPGSVLFPAGTPFTVRSSDLGRVLTTGEPCEQVVFCLIGSDPSVGRFTTTSLFRISSLWGAADSAPYFHDNSAADLDALMEHYKTLLDSTGFALNNPAWFLSDQDRADIINYMMYGFRKHPALLP